MTRPAGIPIALFCAASFLLGPVSPASAQEAPPAASPAHRLAENPEVAARLKVLDAWIGARMANREQPGLSIGIVADQDLVWAKGYGFADVVAKKPATPATAYRIGSLSKLFTATALLQLRDAGRLRLDDPVVMHLQWFTPKNAYPDSPVITIRHLLTHTSGLPRESAASWYWNDMDFPTREEMIRALQGQETVFPSETKFKYSNLALAIAGEVVAKVSGEPYAAYVERHILTPLGMAGTRVLPTPGMPGLAVGYGRRVPGRARVIRPFPDLEGLAPCGNLASTVEDLARFASLQLRDGAAGGAQILKGSTLREMHRVQWLRPDWKSGMGLGFSVQHVDGKVRIGHGGAVPGHRASLRMVPDDRIAVIVLTNASDGRPDDYVNEAFKIVAPALAKAMKPAEAPRVAEDVWQAYLGDYEWDDEVLKVMVLDGELCVVDPTDEDPWEGRLRLQPQGPRAFKMLNGGTEGELVRFEVDAAGRVTRMTMADSYYLPRGH